MTASLHQDDYGFDFTVLKEVDMGLLVEQSRSAVKELEFSEDQHDIWKTLYSRQISQVRKYVCREFLEGLEILGLPEDRIPTIQWLNERITPRTGWRTVRTHVRYSNAVHRYSY
jgi:phenylalanine-4-hydroxylase